MPEKKGNSAVDCPHALSLFPEIINFYYEILSTTVFNISVAEISWFMYCCLAFSYEKSLQKVGFLPFSRATFQEHQRHFALVFGRMQQSSYPLSGMQLFKKAINEIFMENKS